MVSVDDLVISLRIDETSNLGELQKQLTSLVGKKGEKKLDLGTISPDLKRELAHIRTELSFISTQTVPEVLNIKGLQESLHRDRKTLERTFDAAAQRLISKRTTAFQAQLEEYGVKDEPQLKERLEETLRNFIGMMKLGEMGKLPGGVMQKVDFAAKMLIASEKLAEGDRKGLIDKMEKAIGELNVMFSKVLTKAGIQHKAEFNLYQIRKSWYKKQGLDEEAIRLDMDTLLGTDEKVLASYDKIKEFVHHKGGITKFLITAMTKLGISPTPQTFTKEAVKKSPELQAIAVGVLQKAWGTKAGIPTGFHSYLRDLLVKTQSLNVKDIYENARPDFILLNNKLEDLEKIFPPDVAKTLSQMVSYIELKSILTEANKDQFKKYSDMVGDKFLTGVGAVVKDSFKDYFPEIKTAMVNIVSLLEKFFPEKFGTQEELAKSSEERMLEMGSEEKLNEIIKTEEQTKFDTAQIKELGRDIKEIKEASSKIEETTGNTNKKINEPEPISNEAKQVPDEEE